MTKRIPWYDLLTARLATGFRMLNQEDDPTDFARWLRESGPDTLPNTGGKILMSEHTEDPNRTPYVPAEPVTRPADRTPGDRRRDLEKIKAMFSLQQIPDGHTNQARYARNVREMGREFAIIIAENTPVCADQTLAIRKVREAVLWAQEAILREGLV